MFIHYSFPIVPDENDVVFNVEERNFYIYYKNKWELFAILTTDAERLKRRTMKLQKIIKNINYGNTKEKCNLC